MKELEHTDWVRIAESPSFIELHRKKTRFLFGWWICSVLFFFTIPLGAGYLPDLFRFKVIGNINFAYILVIFTFFASWYLSIRYMRWANRVSDPLTAHVVEELAARIHSTGSVAQPMAHT